MYSLQCVRGLDWCKFMLFYSCFWVHFSCTSELADQPKSEEAGAFITLEPQMTGNTLESILSLYEKNGIVHDSLPKNDVEDANIYSQNNLTYRLGNKIVYRFTYLIDRDTVTVMALLDSLTNYVTGWATVDTVTTNKKVPMEIIELEVLVEPGKLRRYYSTKKYHQTEIKYAYYSREGVFIGDEYTGLIDNEENVWLHPPRSLLLQTLQASPWPFVKVPFAIGHAWNWDPVWHNPKENFEGKIKFWEGPLKNKCAYEFLSKENWIMTDRKTVVECLVGIADCSNRIHDTHLKFWFNPNVGFLKLVFDNIDGSTIILEAIDFDVCD